MGHDEVLKRTLVWTRQYILRLVLNTSSTSQPVLHHFLKKATSSHAPSSSGSFPIKCVFDVALMSLLEDGLLSRCGHGNWAQYTIPHDVVKKAMRVAYADFTPDWYDYSNGIGGGQDEGDEAMAMAAMAAEGDVCDAPVLEYSSGCRSPRRTGKRERFHSGGYPKGKIGNVSLSLSRRIPAHKRRKMSSPLYKEHHQPMSP